MQHIPPKPTKQQQEHHNHYSQNPYFRFRFPFNPQKPKKHTQRIQAFHVWDLCI